jgi:hypothetical protein
MNGTDLFDELRRIKRIWMHSGIQSPTDMMNLDES